MKRNLFVCLVLAIALGSQSLAQITITSGDMPIGLGQQYNYREMVSGQSINFSNFSSGTGGGHVWDFSSIDYDTLYTAVSIDKSTAPMQASFASATHCLAFSGLGDHAWTFFSTPSNQLLTHGMVTDTGTTNYVVWIYNQPALEYQFPITNGSSWITKSSYDIEYEGYTITFTDSIEWTCDAWGTAKFNSTEIPCLRIKGTEYSAQIFGGNSISTTSQRLEFLAPDYFGIADLQLSGSIVSGGADDRFVDPVSSVSVMIDDLVPNGFSLSQNCPNPFNPETTIEYAIPTSSEVKFEIFNVLGQTVWHENLGLQQPGSYRLIWSGISDTNEPLSSGVYFYRLTAGNNAVTRKMLLLK